MSTVHELSHPLIASKLASLRDRETSTGEFRRLLRQITLLMGYETTRDLPVTATTVQTPLACAPASVVDEGAITVVPLLRAGFGMLDAMMELLPEASVGTIGLERDEATHEPREYLVKLPEGVGSSTVIVVDPMLATGGSAIAAVNSLKQRGCRNMRMMNLVAAPEGIAAFQSAHPDVDLYVAAIDEGLNDDAYIVPGLGDAGDRIFHTL